jgi:hypothetical protein
MELLLFILSVAAVVLVYACFYPGAKDVISEIASLNPDVGCDTLKKDSISKPE